MVHGSHAHGSTPKTKGNVIHWAPYYDIVTKVLMLGRERSIRKMTLKLAGVRPGDAVLDVGCGTGTLTLAAKAKVGPEGRVTGIDPSPEMIEVARRKAAREGTGIDFQVAVIEDLPFAAATFDVVLSSLMLHHLPEDVKGQGFAETRRVLKPGGRFLAIDFGIAGGSLIGHMVSALTGHSHAHGDTRALTPMLEAAGFADVEAGKTKFGPIWFIRGTAPKIA